MRQRKCSALNCTNKTRTSVKFFKFPLHSPQRLKRWLINMKQEDWQPSHLHMLCIDHFEDQDIDRSGRFVKLREFAVPTIFSFPGHKEKSKAAINPKSRRNKVPASSTSNGKPSIRNKGPCQAIKQTPRYPQKVVKWSIITDEALVQIESFPYFFHGDYCKPQDIQWAPDLKFKTEQSEQSGNIIEVKKPWQWLGVDVRGPLPATLNEHKYILTVTDYYSKWLEALPMQSCVSSQIAGHIKVIISHFGFPFRILSRLPQDIVEEINRDLKEMLKISVSLVVHHRQTGTVDLVTQHLIDSMVADLMQHGADWDVHLPAKVFSLCFKEHSETKQRPFSMLCCKGLQPVHAPRGLNCCHDQNTDQFGWSNVDIQ